MNASLNEEAVKEKYLLWKKCATADPDLIPELESIKGDPAAVQDAFYRDLEFGTAGLRGVIGAGTNRMNYYTVARATRGLGAWIKAQRPGDPSCALCYDSRIKSRYFAETTAGILAAMGVKVYIWKTLMPVPCLSYTVRALGCAAGVMITASHNPSEYNGYKVFGPDGCQITSQGVKEVTAEIEKTGWFDVPCDASFEKGLESGMIEYVPESVYDGYVEEVKRRSALLPGDPADRTMSIVYSPLHGAGLKPVLRVLGECGFGDIFVVPEQRDPDGNFTTCPFPNPELTEALTLGLGYAEKRGADLLFATDPDCDRIGIAVRDSIGQYHVLTGNQTGTLLLDFILRRLRDGGRMPDRPVCVKTIVTAGICADIAAHYGVECADVLTGFKYIGEYIGNLEKEGREDSFVFGFEESCGYLSGSYVRDKDGVVASMLVCEAAANCRARGTNLWDELQRIYSEFGYSLNRGESYYFKGADGFARMKRIMESLRRVPSEIGGLAVTGMKDYKPGLDGLPPSDVVSFRLEGGNSVIIRPSGTEPKIKAYFEVRAKDAAAADALMSRIVAETSSLINGN